MIFLLAVFLVGCSDNHQSGLPKEIETQMEEQLGVEIVVPVRETLQVKFAEIVYPPIFRNQVVGDRREAIIVYTDQRGPLIPLTEEQTAQLENQNRKFYFGEYEGRPVIILEIMNQKSSLAEAISRQIEGIEVEYAQKESASGTFALYNFNFGNGSYMATFRLSDTFSNDDAVAFIKEMIRMLRMGT